MPSTKTIHSRSARVILRDRAPRAPHDLHRRGPQGRLHRPRI